MSINTDFISYIEKSVTAYHTVAEAKDMLTANGFTALDFGSKWNLAEGGKYFITTDGSALIAFVYTSKNKAFNIVAAHSDSPSLKVKFNPGMVCEGMTRLNVETYGGGILYSWLDRRLRIAGRAVFYDKKSKRLFSSLINSDRSVVIPSLAIHMNREVNKGFAINQQVDLLPLVAQGEIDAVKAVIPADYADYTLCDYDLFLYCAEQPFFSGLNGEFLTAPRLDDLCGVYCGLDAIIKASPETVSVLFIADNEEVGSSTKQGAGGTMLSECLARISRTWGKDEDWLEVALNSSFIVSMDNAHSLHPNHPEKNDPTNKCILNKGVVVKHHANQNYTTDAFSSSAFKLIMNAKNLPFQDFFMRSDMPCGGTLGAISSGKVSVRSVDIGLAQLAMHSTMETIGVKDIAVLSSALTAFYETGFNNTLSDSMGVNVK